MLETVATIPNVADNIIISVVDINNTNNIEATISNSNVVVGVVVFNTHGVNLETTLAQEGASQIQIGSLLPARTRQLMTFQNTRSFMMMRALKTDMDWMVEVSTIHNKRTHQNPSQRRSNSISSDG